MISLSVILLKFKIIFLEYIEIYQLRFIQIKPPLENGAFIWSKNILRD